MKRLLGKLFIGKKRKALLEDFAKLVLEIPKANSLNEIKEGYIKIGDFAKKLNHDKKDEPLRQCLANMIAYLTDTREHIEKGYHKPFHNGYKTITVYPDINDYVNLGVRLKTF